ncbi:PREDICTED: F-box protein CPR30-like [Fragaria vesca subsp. vesca]|uniref:F-box protein CPR30-like n=1 Tax=Fragaria vesca subsp. vesca TaxID=101020 RepID=UPI0002C2ED4F|nr:PREDICTED: F-box protein CPR30-like [Fragaria vesca subsp. vesca]XP_011466618.1 PREDICTED: F-box protein CPR30-like [Fragaria vesca subsp. vesca]
MEEANLPEEMIVLILTWLPVKSLLRFTCVSKRFHSIILSDPKFAKSQFEAARDRKTLDHTLIYSVKGPRFGSLDLGTPSFGDPSSARNLNLPFQSPAPAVALLGSCNGIVFLAFDEKIVYVWNPSTGFFKKLPHPVFSPIENGFLIYGVGYLPATDDYRVLVVSVDCIDDKDGAAVYSSRAHAWKTLEVAAFSSFSFEGTLLKEALHWLSIRNEIFAFDLTQQEEYKFRKMLPPLCVGDDNGQNHGHLGVSAGGCLSLACCSTDAADCIHVWVMREYDVRDSWTKLFNLKFDPPKEPWDYIHGAVLVVETGMVAGIIVHNNYYRGLVKILHNEDKCSLYKVEDIWLDCIQYQESLLRIDD